MKFRLALISALLLLGLVSCSLAEDITPPPDYVSPTVALTDTPVPPTSTPMPPTATRAATETVAASTDAAGTAITPEASATPLVQTGTVNGKVVNGSGNTIPDGLIVTLRGFDMPTDNTGQPNEAVNQSMSLPTSGQYEFTNVEMPSGRIFLVEVDDNGVPYQSDYLVTETAALTLPDLTLYDATDDYTVLTVNQVHVALDYSTPNTVQVIEMYVMTNSTTKTVTVATDGTSIPFVKIPEGATNVNFQIANGSATFLGTSFGFALTPSKAGEQYGLVAIFEFPYTKKISLTQVLVLPAEKVTFFAPDGVKVSSKMLTDTGLQDFNGTSYRVYEASGTAADTSISLTITGTPKTTSTTSTKGGVTSQQWLIIGLGALGMALVGIGLFFFIRDRRMAREEELEEGEEGEEGKDGEKPAEEEPTDALGNDRDAILDAILALDDQFKAGEITKEVYETRRAELKERLKNLG